MKRGLIIGKSGRLDCIVDALARSRQQADLFVFSEVDNPGLRAKAIDVRRGKTDNPEQVVAYAREVRPDFAIIGPEEPLAVGMVDALEGIGVPTVGPKKAVARIEWSKAFARRILTKHFPSVNPRFEIFTSLADVPEYLKKLGRFVIKPDGLTGGKGVKVFGEHFQSNQEGVDYCREVFEAGHSNLIIEELIEGEEFTLQSFSDGRHVVHTFPIQDHKRLLDGDLGPNTGGMASYSFEDHCLPFLTPEDLKTARAVNETVCAALRDEVGIEYKGILYGGFIATGDGVKVIEFNSRFGDPEVMNLLPILETDFLELCEAILEGRLSPDHVRFARRATVVKYLAPTGYVTSTPQKGSILKSDIPPSNASLRVFYAAVNDLGNGELGLSASRAIAFVGIGENLEAAGRIAEAAAARVAGPVQHRTDVGTWSLIEKRVAHMTKLRFGP